MILDDISGGQGQTGGQVDANAIRQNTKWIAALQERGEERALRAAVTEEESSSLSAGVAGRRPSPGNHGVDRADKEVHRKEADGFPEDESIEMRRRLFVGMGCQPGNTVHLWHVQVSWGIQGLALAAGKMHALRA